MNRKELKKAARQSIRTHYLKLLFVCLLAAIMGIEYQNTLELFSAYRVAEDPVQALTELETLKTDYTPGNGLGGIWSDILSGHITESFETVQNRIRAFRDSDIYIGHLELGHSRGVLASVINMLTSGELLTLLFTLVDSITGSNTLTVAVLSIVGFLISFVFWAMFMNAYRVIMKRLFLEARIYRELPAERFLFLVRIRKWLSASRSMLLYMLVTLGSSLLIIPGPFLHYFYFLTPYLVAENPALKPIQALRISRQMMKGHKLEAFKLELSLFPWRLLSLITGGIAGLFFANAYNEAVLAEYYAFIRSTCIEDDAYQSVLIDKYLFRRADSDTLQHAYAETVSLMKTSVVLPQRKGFWGFMTRNFGVIRNYDKEEQLYRREARKQLQLDEYHGILEGDTYPARLSPFIEHRRTRMSANTDYMRHYSIPVLIIMFFAFSLFGWSWEVTLHLLEYGTFVNRGVLHGPWLPIYGSGGLLILLLLYRFRSRPHLEFFAIVILSAIVEYGTSVVLEVMYGQKWWDYSGYFLNLNGRICAEGLLVFGIGGIVVVYLVAPVMDDYLARIRSSVIRPVCLALLLIFAADNIYSGKHPNMGEGVTDLQPGGSDVLLNHTE
ncbi:MAG: DUF975 family protein [Clostridia bacterium]|nr:DUF975 family protein [Clostridia bacterium]